MFSNLFPPICSGSSTHAYGLAREFVKRGRNVVAVTARIDTDSAPYEVSDGVHIYRIPAYRLPALSVAFNFGYLSYTYTPSNWNRIEEIFRKHQINIIHVHNHMFDLALSAAKLKKRLNVPIVATIHTVIKHTNPFYNFLLATADRQFLKRWVIDRTAALICPDVNIQAYVEETFNRMNDPLIPYGIEPLPPPDERRVGELRQKHNLDGKRVILSLGHIHELRNRKDIVAALPLVKRDVPDTVLLIVGAEYTPIPRQLAHELGVQDSVIFTGAVPHQDIPNYMALADLQAQWLSQDSPDRTSLGIAVLEGMSAGKVILTVANPDTHGPGVIQNGTNIVIVEPNQPESLACTIVELFRDDERRFSIGHCAKETILQHFSWDSVCQRIGDVYDSVLKEHKI